MTTSTGAKTSLKSLKIQNGLGIFTPLTNRNGFLFKFYVAKLLKKVHFDQSNNGDIVDKAKLDVVS